MNIVKHKKSNSISYCMKEQKPCLGWADKYFKDCLCNFRDELSFALGFVSLLCWAVAEIPQIITNFRTKSSHGVSLIFLLTWVAGDFFNLIGCLLEPATLPTQYYTAVLYTASTVILVFQSLYYEHVYKWLKSRKSHSNLDQVEEECTKPLNPEKSNNSSIPITRSTDGHNVKASPHRDYYYTSARSLAGSSTPPIRSYLWPTRSGPAAAMVTENDSSSEDESPSTTTIQIPTNRSVSRPQPIPRSVGYGAFLGTSLDMPQGSKALMQAYVGRKLLQGHGSENAVYGQWLGWMMAAIYMGGRIPQIILNIKRGSVEGLNPLMFIFAIVANAAYVGSILVRSTEWVKIKANMPWLLDAAACVALDSFIISQYIYYRYIRKRESSDYDEEYYRS